MKTNLRAVQKSVMTLANISNTPSRERRSRALKPFNPQPSHRAANPYLDSFAPPFMPLYSLVWKDSTACSHVLSLLVPDNFDQSNFSIFPHSSERDRFCVLCGVNFDSGSGETHCASKKHHGAIVMHRTFQEQLWASSDCNNSVVFERFERYVDVRRLIASILRSRDVIKVYNLLLHFAEAEDDRSASSFLVAATKLAIQRGQRGTELVIKASRSPIEESKAPRESMSEPDLVDEQDTDDFDESDHFFREPDIDNVSVDDSELDQSTLDWNLSDEEDWEAAGIGEQAGLVSPSTFDYFSHQGDFDPFPSSPYRAEACIAALAFENFY